MGKGGKLDLPAHLSTLTLSLPDRPKLSPLLVYSVHALSNAIRFYSSRESLWVRKGLSSRWERVNVGWPSVFIKMFTLFSLSLCIHVHPHIMLPFSFSNLILYPFPFWRVSWNSRVAITRFFCLHSSRIFWWKMCDPCLGFSFASQAKTVLFQDGLDRKLATCSFRTKACCYIYRKERK